MEWRFVIRLHSSFYSILSLDITPLNSFLISSQLRQFIYINVIE